MQRPAPPPGTIGAGHYAELAAAACEALLRKGPHTDALFQAGSPETAQAALTICTNLQLRALDAAVLDSLQPPFLLDVLRCAVGSAVNDAVLVEITDLLCSVQKPPLPRVLRIFASFSYFYRRFCTVFWATVRFAAKSGASPRAVTDCLAPLFFKFTAMEPNPRDILFTRNVFSAFVQAKQPVPPSVAPEDEFVARVLFDNHSDDGSVSMGELVKIVRTGPVNVLKARKADGSVVTIPREFVDLEQKIAPNGRKFLMLNFPNDISVPLQMPIPVKATSPPMCPAPEIVRPRIVSQRAMEPVRPTIPSSNSGELRRALPQPSPGARPPTTPQSIPPKPHIPAARIVKPGMPIPPKIAPAGRAIPPPIRAQPGRTTPKLPTQQNFEYEGGTLPESGINTLLDEKTSFPPPGGPIHTPISVSPGLLPDDDENDGLIDFSTFVRSMTDEGNNQSSIELIDRHFADFEPDSLLESLVKLGIRDPASVHLASCERLARIEEPGFFLRRNLDSDEAGAIAAYVHKHPNMSEKNPHDIVNFALTKRDSEDLFKARSYLHLLLRGLRKLPLQSFPALYRGVFASVTKEKYKVGKIVTWHAFSATSGDARRGRQFLGNAGRGTFFTIIGNVVGYNISMFTDKREDEVLLEPFSVFRVVSTNFATTPANITLEMIGSNFLLIGSVPSTPVLSATLPPAFIESEFSVVGTTVTLCWKNRIMKQMHRLLHYSVRVCKASDRATVHVLDVEAEDDEKTYCLIEHLEPYTEYVFAVSKRVAGNIVVEWGPYVYVTTQGQSAVPVITSVGAQECQCEVCCEFAGEGYLYEVVVLDFNKEVVKTIIDTCPVTTIGGLEPETRYFVKARVLMPKKPIPDFSKEEMFTTKMLTSKTPFLSEFAADLSLQLEGDCESYTATKSYDDTTRITTMAPLLPGTVNEVKFTLRSETSSGSMFVGIIPSECLNSASCVPENDGWFFCVKSGELFSGPPGYFYKDAVVSGEFDSEKEQSVTMQVDMKNGTVRYVLNGEDLGEVFEGIPTRKEMYPMVVLTEKGDSVTIHR